MPTPPDKDPFDFQRDDTNRISDTQAIHQQHRAFQSLETGPQVERRRVDGKTFGYKFPLRDESGELTGSFAEIHSHPTKVKDEDGNTMIVRAPGAFLTINRQGKPTHFKDFESKGITKPIEERAFTLYETQKQAKIKAWEEKNMQPAHAATHEPALSAMSPHVPHGQVASYNELSPQMAHHSPTHTPGS